MTETFKLLDSLVCDAHVWVAGKGPSLNKFDWSKAGPHRVGVNQAAFLVPDCWAAIAVDYDREQEYLESLGCSIIVMRKSCHWQRSFPIMYLFEKGPTLMDLSATAPILFQILANSGAKVLHLVGFDSIDRVEGYASTEWAPPDHCGDNTKQQDYDKINQSLLRIAAERSLELVWEHRS